MPLPAPYAAASPPTTIQDAGPVGNLPDGSITYQGGYTDPQGANHSWPSAPGVLHQAQTALTPGAAAQQPQSQAPFQTDPGYQAALAQQQMGLTQLDASLKASRERAIIDFGDPALASMAGFGLDPQAAAFAKQNYLSGNASLARLDKNHDLMRQAVINRLASHGILASGDLGYGTGQADEQYGNQVYDAKKTLLDYLNGVTQTDLQNRQQLSGGVISALQNAYGNFLNHPEMYPADAPTAATAPPAVRAPVKTAAKAAATTTKAKAVQRVLVNPYTTGQKRFG